MVESRSAAASAEPLQVAPSDFAEAAAKVEISQLEAEASAVVVARVESSLSEFLAVISAL